VAWWGEGGRGGGFNSYVEKCIVIPTIVFIGFFSSIFYVGVKTPPYPHPPPLAY
jgi:hypothetical protein